MDWVTDFLKEDIKDIATKPSAIMIIRLLEKGNIEKAHNTYIGAKKNGTLYMTMEEIQRTQSKRINERNKRRYGKNFSRDRKFYRNKVYLRQRGICAICNIKCPIGEMTLDHIKQVAQGGTSDISNLQMLCKTCHYEKDKHLMNVETKFEKPYGTIR